jgi:hypothetical protein
VAEARDFGFVMNNAVDIDLAASARRYREFHADWPQRVAAEADWLAPAPVRRTAQQCRLPAACGGGASRHPRRGLVFAELGRPVFQLFR